MDADADAVAMGHVGDDMDAENEPGAWNAGQNGVEAPVHREVGLPVPISEAGTVDQEIFQRATVVSIAEVSHYLARFVEAQQRDRGVAAHPSVQKVLEYCQKFAPSTSQAAEENLRKSLRAMIPNDYYLGQVLNLRPETADELRHLVPQLDPDGRESLYQHGASLDADEVVLMLESVREAAV